jgi:hypothetical protein
VLPKKPAYQRFIARQQLRKYATVLEPLLGGGPRAPMEVQLEAVFSMWSAPRLYHSIDRVPNSSTNDRPVLSSESSPSQGPDSNCQTVLNIWTWSPDGLDNKTDRLTDRQSQCDSDSKQFSEFQIMRREWSYSTVPNSSVASKQATRRGAPVQPVERDKKNSRTSDCGDCNCNCKGVGQ